MTVKDAAEANGEFAPSQALPAVSRVRIRDAERREVDTLQVLLPLLHVAPGSCEIVLVVDIRHRGLGVDRFVHRVQDPVRMFVAVGFVPGGRACRVRT